MVALLAEGVDRNCAKQYRQPCEQPVALLAEGVDRNLDEMVEPLQKEVSPSSRRAWIEILAAARPPTGGVVALLAEGVDRNLRTELPSW